LTVRTHGEEPKKTYFTVSAIISPSRTDTNSIISPAPNPTPNSIPNPNPIPNGNISLTVSLSLR